MTEKLMPDIAIDVPDGGFTIGEAAAALGIPMETLRYWDRAGLLRDETPRNAGGQRRYGRSDLEWIAGVIMLRETGMGVGGIREIAALSRTPGTEGERLAFFEAHRRQVQSELARTRRHLAAIEQKIAAYRAVVEEEDES
jgi:DNA-binding transcriptional MerR regulator